MWRGPRPSPRWKAERVVNWQPIRQLGRLEGSVWQQVNKNLEEHGFCQLSREELNRAFMRLKQEDGSVHERAPLRRPRQPLRRLFPPRAALTADLLHARLVRQGVADPDALTWAVGLTATNDGDGTSGDGTQREAATEATTDVASDSLSDNELTMSNPSLADTSITDTSFTNSMTDTVISNGKIIDSSLDDVNSMPSFASKLGEKEAVQLDEEALDALVALLRLAVGLDERLNDAGRSCSDDETPWAPPESLLHGLFHKVPCVNTMLCRAELLLHMARFSQEAAYLEGQLHDALDAAAAAMGSKAIPLFLEGVLLLGNYVNASGSMGGALGVSLASLRRLAHTRCLKSSLSNPSARKDHALLLLARQLEEREPGFVEMLAEDLRPCCSARDVDPKQVATGVVTLKAQVTKLEEWLENASHSKGEPPALRRAHLQRFLSQAVPRVGALTGLVESLEQTTQSLRRHFAETDTSSLPEMLGNLADLLQVLPVPAGLVKKTAFVDFRRQQQQMQQQHEPKQQEPQLEYKQQPTQESLEMPRLPLRLPLRRRTLPARPTAPSQQELPATSLLPCGCQDSSCAKEEDMPHMKVHDVPTPLRTRSSSGSFHREVAKQVGCASSSRGLASTLGQLGWSPRSTAVAPTPRS